MDRFFSSMSMRARFPSHHNIPLRADPVEGPPDDPGNVPGVVDLFSEESVSEMKGLFPALAVVVDRNFFRGFPGEQIRRGQADCTSPTETAWTQRGRSGSLSALSFGYRARRSSSPTGISSPARDRAR